MKHHHLHSSFRSYRRIQPKPNTDSIWVLTFDGSSGPGKAVLGGYRDRWFLINLSLSYLAVLVGAVAIFRLDRNAFFKLVAVNVGMVFVLVLFELQADRLSERLHGCRWLGADAEPIPYVFETDRYGRRWRASLFRRRHASQRARP